MAPSLDDSWGISDFVADGVDDWGPDEVAAFIHATADTFERTMLVTDPLDSAKLTAEGSDNTEWINASTHGLEQLESATKGDRTATLAKCYLSQSSEQCDTLMKESDLLRAAAERTIGLEIDGDFLVGIDFTHLLKALKLQHPHSERSATALLGLRIDHLKRRATEQPKDFWEWRAANRRTAYMLSYASVSYPQLVLLEDLGWLNLVEGDPLRALTAQSPFHVKGSLKQIFVQLTIVSSAVSLFALVNQFFREENAESPRALKMVLAIIVFAMFYFLWQIIIWFLGFMMYTGDITLVPTLPQLGLYLFPYTSLCASIWQWLLTAPWLVAPAVVSCAILELKTFRVQYLHGTVAWNNGAQRGTAVAERVQTIINAFIWKHLVLRLIGGWLAVKSMGFILDSTPWWLADLDVFLSMIMRPVFAFYLALVEEDHFLLDHENPRRPRRIAQLVGDGTWLHFSHVLWLIARQLPAVAQFGNLWNEQGARIANALNNNANRPLRPPARPTEQQAFPPPIVVPDEIDAEPPKELCCPITLSLFTQPAMIVTSGHTYEYDAIATHAANTGPKCPLTQRSFKSPEQLMPNWGIRALVEKWIEENRKQKAA